METSYSEMNATPQIFLVGRDEKILPPETSMTKLRSMNQQEFLEFKSALQEFVEFASHLALFRICERNFLELSNTYRGFRDEFFSSLQMDSVINDKILDEINRLFMNYLASFRTVLDHFQTRYTRIDEQIGSGFLASFKTITSNAFDTSFAYRFLSKLRNYVQHCGLPAEGVATEVLPQSDGSQHATFGIYLERDSLLAKFDDWGKVKPELESQLERIEILELVIELRNEIRKMFGEFARLELEIIDVPRKKFAALAVEVESQIPGAVPLVADYSQVNKAGGSLQTLGVPVGELKKIDKIQADIESGLDEIFGV